MLRGLWTWVILVPLTVACALPSLVVSVVRPGSNMVMQVGRLWSQALLWLCGARVTYEGLSRCRADRPSVFIANHQSYVDIWALMSVLPPSSRFVAKQELRRVPVLGWAMAASGFVFVDRRHRGRAIHSLRGAARAVRAGRSLVLFPEGTRTRDGTLLPFKKGPFHLALQAGVPIVPVAICGSWRVLKPRSLRITPGPVRVRFLDPIDLAPYAPDDVEGLRSHVHETLRRQLETDGDARP